MKIRSYTVDTEADAAYCYLADRPIQTTDEIASGIVIDRDEEGRPVGVEVLWISERLAGSDPLSFLSGLVEGLFARRLEAAE